MLWSNKKDIRLHKETEVCFITSAPGYSLQQSVARVVRRKDYRSSRWDVLFERMNGLTDEQPVLRYGTGPVPENLRIRKNSRNFFRTPKVLITTEAVHLKHTWAQIMKLGSFRCRLFYLTSWALDYWATAPSPLHKFYITDLSPRQIFEPKTSGPN